MTQSILSFTQYIGIIIVFASYSYAQPMKLLTPHEKDVKHTTTYHELIEFYKHLESTSDILSVQEIGSTDSGLPLHEIIIDIDGLTNPMDIKEQGKAILFINNGIHPGEPCGIDASMIFARELLANSIWKQFLNEVTVVIIPIYNIGGMLNRNSHSRANQNGPVAYGFRGNAKNYDLNRDFIKCDSRNAQTFNQLFNKWSPDFFIDNHTSNGADYQYTMTLIATQKDKLAPSLKDVLTLNILPDLYEMMEKDNYKMIPYVDLVGETPEEGITDFVDYGRYSTGYAALHHTIGFMPETHMLKPFEDRVESTLLFLRNSLRILTKYKAEILQAKEDAIQYYQNFKQYAIDWEISKNQKETIEFDGYQSVKKPSLITGMDRLFYDRSRPYTKEIAYFNTATETKEVDIPIAYIIPQAYTKIIERLKWNNVQVEELNEDKIFQVSSYYIDEYETLPYPYEGHYLHSDVKIKIKEEDRAFRKGDILVYMNQAANRYIIETLEPQAPDSYFNWNFMDAILQQKEYFSPYVFEDLAVQHLEEHPELRLLLEERKGDDEEFRNNSYAQLKFIYKHSPYYEKTHNRYPIAKFYGAER